MPVTVSPAALEGFIRDIFQAAGVSPADAAAAAPSFVWASLRGVDSHGISRVPRYVEMFGSGVANPTPDITVADTAPGVAVVDADFAPGPVALTRAADIGIEKAKAQGVAIVSVRNTVHTGAIGYYVSRIADAGLVGIGIAAGSPMMSYEGAVGASVATSPLAVAVPGTGAHAPVLLDMASSLIALGKIAQYKREGKPLPEGAATTADGTPTTDPELAKIPTPLGGPKGSGLSLVFELLTSVLVAAVGSQPGLSDRRRVWVFPPVVCPRSPPSRLSIASPPRTFPAPLRCAPLDVGGSPCGEITLAQQPVGLGALTSAAVRPTRNALGELFLGRSHRASRTRHRPSGRERAHG